MREEKPIVIKLLISQDKPLTADQKTLLEGSDGYIISYDDLLAPHQADGVITITPEFLKEKIKKKYVYLPYTLDGVPANFYGHEHQVSNFPNFVQNIDRISSNKYTVDQAIKNRSQEAFRNKNGQVIKLLINNREQIDYLRSRGDVLLIENYKTHPDLLKHIQDQINSGRIKYVIFPFTEDGEYPVGIDGITLTEDSFTATAAFAKVNKDYGDVKHVQMQFAGELINQLKSESGEPNPPQKEEKDNGEQKDSDKDKDREKEKAKYQQEEKKKEKQEEKRKGEKPIVIKVKINTGTDFFTKVSHLEADDGVIFPYDRLIETRIENITPEFLNEQVKSKKYIILPYTEDDKPAQSDGNVHLLGQLGDGRVAKFQQEISAICSDYKEYTLDGALDYLTDKRKAAKKTEDEKTSPEQKQSDSDKGNGTKKDEEKEEGTEKDKQGKKDKQDQKEDTDTVEVVYLELGDLSELTPDVIKEIAPPGGDTVVLVPGSAPDCYLLPRYKKDFDRDTARVITIPVCAGTSTEHESHYHQIQLDQQDGKGGVKKVNAKDVKFDEKTFKQHIQQSITLGQQEVDSHRTSSQQKCKRIIIPSKDGKPYLKDARNKTNVQALDQGIQAEIANGVKKFIANIAKSKTVSESSKEFGDQLKSVLKQKSISSLNYPKVLGYLQSCLVDLCLRSNRMEGPDGPYYEIDEETKSIFLKKIAPIRDALNLIQKDLKEPSDNILRNVSELIKKVEAGKLSVADVEGTKLISRKIDEKGDPLASKKETSLNLCLPISCDDEKECKAVLESWKEKNVENSVLFLHSKESDTWKIYFIKNKDKEREETIVDANSQFAKDLKSLMMDKDLTDRRKDFVKMDNSSLTVDEHGEKVKAWINESKPNSVLFMRYKYSPDWIAYIKDEKGNITQKWRVPPSDFEKIINEVEDKRKLSSLQKMFKNSQIRLNRSIVDEVYSDFSKHTSGEIPDKIVSAMKDKLATDLESKYAGILSFPSKVIKTSGTGNNCLPNSIAKWLMRQLESDELDEDFQEKLNEKLGTQPKSYTEFHEQYFRGNELPADEEDEKEDLQKGPNFLPEDISKLKIKQAEKRLGVALREIGIDYLIENKESKDKGNLYTKLRDDTWLHLELAFLAYVGIINDQQITPEAKALGELSIIERELIKIDSLKEDSPEMKEWKDPIDDQDPHYRQFMLNHRPPKDDLELFMCNEKELVEKKESWKANNKANSVLLVYLSDKKEWKKFVIKGEGQTKTTDEESIDPRSFLGVKIAEINKNPITKDSFSKIDKSKLVKEYDEDVWCSGTSFYSDSDEKHFKNLQLQYKKLQVLKQKWEGDSDQVNSKAAGPKSGSSAERGLFLQYLDHLKKPGEMLNEVTLDAILKAMHLKARVHKADKSGVEEYGDPSYSGNPIDLFFDKSSSHWSTYLSEGDLIEFNSNRRSNGLDPLVIDRSTAEATVSVSGYLNANFNDMKTELQTDRSFGAALVEIFLGQDGQPRFNPPEFKDISENRFKYVFEEKVAKQGAAKEKYEIEFEKQPDGTMTFNSYGGETMKAEEKFLASAKMALEVCFKANIHEEKSFHLTNIDPPDKVEDCMQAFIKAGFDKVTYKDKVLTKGMLMSKSEEKKAEGPVPEKKEQKKVSDKVRKFSDVPPSKFGDRASKLGGKPAFFYDRKELGTKKEYEAKSYDDLAVPTVPSIAREKDSTKHTTVDDLSLVPAKKSPEFKRLNEKRDTSRLQELCGQDVSSGAAALGLM